MPRAVSPPARGILSSQRPPRWLLLFWRTVFRAAIEKVPKNDGKKEDGANAASSDVLQPEPWEKAALYAAAGWLWLVSSAWLISTFTVSGWKGLLTR